MTKLVKSISRLNAVQLVARSLFIEERLKDNDAFTNLSPTLAEIAGHREALEQAITEATDGGRTATARRESRKQELKLALDALAGDVISQAGDDAELILLAGFFLRTNSRSNEAISMPLKLRARIGDQDGEARLDWATTRHAAIYVVEHNAVSPDDASAWKQVAETTRIRHTVSGLAGAKVHWFRVRALGTTGRSPWSDVAHTLVR
ncbi:MAG: fibronectin type III domain-containing protein [Flavobacteriales bacterium]|nr:fibronectin type III domain-containing protein [Flavobacteriales bacterium]MBK7484536.1 fibronectin type III domain-containing protein [Flavobacteriales bacterium]